MEKYFSKNPIWYVPSQNALGLSGKSVLLILPDGSMSPHDLRIDVAPLDSREHGKIAVSIFQDSVKEEPEASIKGQPSIFRIHHSEQFLTQDALDLIRLPTEPLPVPADFVMMIPSSQEPFDR